MPTIKALDLPVSEMKNFEVGLLWSFVSTCATHPPPPPPPPPRARPVLTPGASIIWTKLIEVYKEMLFTKYQSSRPSSFRKQEFWKWASLFLYSNLWPPWTELVFDHWGIIWIQWRCYIPNIKALGLLVSEKKNFENGLLCSYIPTCDPWGRASFELTW